MSVENKERSMTHGFSFTFIWTVSGSVKILLPETTDLSTKRSVQMLRSQNVVSQVVLFPNTDSEIHGI